MKRKKVTVVLVSRKLDDTINFIDSMQNQSYDNFEIIVGYSLESSYSKKISLLSHDKVIFCGCSRIHGKYELQLSDNEIFIQCSRKINGDYVLLTDDMHEYGDHFIENAVLEIEKTGADYYVTDYRVHWGDDALAQYKISDYNDSVISYITHAGYKWWVRVTENKLFKFDFINDVFNEMSNYYSKSNSHFYIDDLLISSVVVSKSRKICTNTDGNSYVILNWVKQDAEIINLYNNISSKDIIKELKKTFDYIESIFSRCSNKELLRNLKEKFLSNLIWRISWKFKDLSKLVKDVYKEYKINEFSLELIGNDSILIDKCYKNKTSNTNVITDDLNIGIFVSMHKESFVPKNKYIIPIQVGTSLSNNKIEAILHDDDYNDNISSKNKMYCEMTAQYAVWKNIHDLDYYGFWHYRRYFSFNKDEVEDEYALIRHRDLNEKSLAYSNIDEYHILEVCKNYDIILPNEWHIKENGKFITVYEQWCNHFDKHDIDATIKVILEKFPEYTDAVFKTLYSEYAVYCNMFIMKKEYFEEYSDFCFIVLGELEKILNQDLYNTEQYRTLGHIAERLLPIYISYITERKPLTRVYYTGRTLYEHTVPVASVKKPNKNNCVSLMLACSDYYMKYTCVLLESLNCNINDDFFYDVIICHRGISEYNQSIARSIFSNRNNFQLRFVDVSRNFEEYEKLYVDRHFTLETYYRFLMLDIFKEYDRILYLDCDVIINDDISELYFTDLTGYSLAAVRDYDFIGGALESQEFYTNNILRYINIDSITNYFQAGVILFNINEIRKSYTTRDLFETALSRNWFYVDQDVLNCLFNGHVKYLDDRWNVFSLLHKGSIREHRINIELVARFASSYKKSLEHPAIVHYAGSPKVWNDTEVHLGYLFWKYARRSPFYESLIESLLLGEGSRHDWIVFCSPANCNVSTLFFTIEPVIEDWASSYCVIDFDYLTNHGNLITNTLYVNISRLQNKEGKFELVLKDFYWQNDSKVFNYIYSNIRNDTNNLEVYVKHFEQYAGFSFTVRSLESRSIVKPFIKIKNHHHIF